MMESKAIKKVEILLRNKCAGMVAEHFQLTLNPEGSFPQEGFFYSLRDMTVPTDFRFGSFPQIWEGYVRSLSDEVSSWNDYSFVVVRDPWDNYREIPISTEVATKVLVLGGFP